MRVHQVRLSPSRQAFYVVKSRGTNCIRSLNQIDELIASKYRRTINNYSGFFLFLGVFLFLNQLVVEAASGRLNHPMNTSTSRSNRYEDLYIVLVSIPLLDKVLPLKHLAEELILRGYRVGFALPEVIMNDTTKKYGNSS
jgi:hypothetical protein